MTKKIQTIATLAGVMVIIFLINSILLGGTLNSFGIKPRTVDGLIGILASPFLHANLAHLLNNLVGFSIFSMLIMLQGLRYYWRASAVIIILGGLGVWLFGRSSVHIGASGWIFGLWALCIANAWFTRNFKNFVIAAVVIIAWGGMIFGVLPKNSYISFEAHLMGAIAGIIAAAMFKKRR